MEHGGSFSHYGQNTKSSGNSSRSNPIWDNDENLPNTKVIQIMQQVLPQNAEISVDAVETVQRCASEFIRFITGAAIDHSQRDKKKIISAEDLLSVMESMGFDDYVRPLTLYLHRYRNHSMHHEQLGIANDGILSPPPPQSLASYLPGSSMEAPNENPPEISSKASLDKTYEDGVGDVEGF